MPDEATRRGCLHSKKVLWLKKSKSTRIQDGHTEYEQKQKGIVTEEELFQVSKPCFYLKITEFEDHIADSYIIGLLVVLITPLIFRLL